MKLFGLRKIYRDNILWLKWMWVESFWKFVYNMIDNNYLIFLIDEIVWL